LLTARKCRLRQGSSGPAFHLEVEKSALVKF
jgi:hypothetical protein